jgi:hypothetical protein
MIGSRRARIASTVVVVALSAAALVGCSNATSATGSSSSSSAASGAAVATSGTTALGNLGAAVSSLSTTAPDAKLLVVQTAQAVTPTGTPVWAYLFGSPSTDKTYVVYSTNGMSMGAQLYGTAGLSAADWAKVPGTGTWKVDSDAALAKALTASKASGQPARYIMGFTTYKPVDSTSTALPFVWNVQIDTSGTVGAVAAGFDVDARTGKTTVN